MTDGATGAVTAPAPAANRTRLAVEAALLFVAVPIAHVVYFETLGPFLPLGFVFAVAILLLAITPGFRWRELVAFCGFLRHVPMIVILFVACVAVLFGLTLLLAPERFLSFPRYAPETYLMVIALYPFLSVLGQEIAYRLLFFKRYRVLFPNDTAAIVASAAVFAAAHGFFLNWIAVTLSFAGGLVFAWAYARTGSFPLVWILHSLAGQVLFTSGLGIYFYHGAIPG